MALRHAPLLLVLAASASWAATPATDAQTKCLSQTSSTSACYQLLRTAVDADRITIRGLEARVSRLQKTLGHRQYPVRRSRQEIEEAKRVFNSEFNDLRKTPGAFALASDLVVERMKDPRYAAVPLDMIVRDVGSTVQRVASAGNEELVAETEAAKREAAQTREDANRAINDAYDKAERVVDAAQAIVQGSASDADMAAAMAAINSFPRPTTAPDASAPAPYTHCTSRKVGQGEYAHVETDCN